MGARDGLFDVEDPDYTANVLWTQILGTTHLARIRVGIRQAAPGIPEPREGIQTQTLRKTAEGWLIAAFQNTNAVPERPFPLGPPQLVDPGKLRVGHEHLASNLEQVWDATVQSERNVAHGAQIRRDVVTPLAIAARSFQASCVPSGRSPPRSSVRSTASCAM